MNEKTVKPETTETTETTETAKAEEAKDIKQELSDQLASWQTRIDEARVQMNLGAKEMEDKVQPYVDLLENEMHQAKKQLDKLGKDSESAWDEIQLGLAESVETMKASFEKAKKHFPDDKT